MRHVPPQLPDNGAQILRSFRELALLHQSQDGGVAALRHGKRSLIRVGSPLSPAYPRRPEGVFVALQSVVHLAQAFVNPAQAIAWRAHLFGHGQSFFFPFPFH